MERPLTHMIPSDGHPLNLAEYKNAGGYQALKKALGMTPQDVRDIVKDSNLMGRGGAGFPTGVKWGFVPMGDDTSELERLNDRD